jgi:hypothetical protein
MASDTCCRHGRERDARDDGIRRRQAARGDEVGQAFGAAQFQEQPRVVQHLHQVLVECRIEFDGQQPRTRMHGLQHGCRRAAGAGAQLDHRARAVATPALRTSRCSSRCELGMTEPTCAGLRRKPRRNSRLSRCGPAGARAAERVATRASRVGRWDWIAMAWWIVCLRAVRRKRPDSGWTAPRAMSDGFDNLHCRVQARQCGNTMKHGLCLQSGLDGPQEGQQDGDEGA